VPECTYPLTGTGCVSRVYTPHAVFEVGRADGAVAVLATYGSSVEELARKLGVRLVTGAAPSD